MRKQHSYYVYILTNPNRKVLYVGVTNNLARRLVEHYANKGKRKTFAGRYYTYGLIYYEHFQYINRAIAREKEIKKWNRQRKEGLIASKNPNWEFYNKTFCGEWPPRKAWGNYLEKFKQQKAIEEEPTVCIYQEEQQTNLVESKAVSVLSKPVAIEPQVLGSQKLSNRENLLVKIALLISLDHQEELSVLLKELPKDKVTKEDLEAILVQVGVCAGFSIMKDTIEKYAYFFDKD